MKKRKELCQSCGMPMFHDSQKGGTEKDGGKSSKYCSFCYRNGSFTFKGSMKEFQEFCRDMLIKSGNSKFKAWLYSRSVRYLERWK